MAEQIFSFLDQYFSGFLAERSALSGAAKERFRELAARVSAALAEGHSCLPLTAAESDFLSSNPLVSEGGPTPLVLHNRRLYLHRYYHYETRLAGQIKKMAAGSMAADGDLDLADRYFPASGPDTDWQREAAMVALRKALTIICGGPGTGKTTTVVKILALILQAGGREHNLAVALAAPTGKAAMRLSEAIARNLRGLDLPETVKKALPTSAATLHRLLGVQRHSPQFRHNRDNPLIWDLVVVDEASMVDLALMSKLVDAIKPGARLILLGDKDQLASVESGAVLGDLITSLPDNTVELRKTYRFEAGIRQLAVAINRADSRAAWDCLTDSHLANLAVIKGDFITLVAERYGRYMAMVHKATAADLPSLFTALNSFRVLCALHFGSRGVLGINRQVEMALARRGFPCRPEDWYPGRPILITQNDYNLDLYNGDIGICLPGPGNGPLQVWFEQADGGQRCYPPTRLPCCETVFAMTIHKSQGSEFDEVMVVLPETDNRILSRQLIYTAVTRAKKAVRLVADQEILHLALSRNIARASGLVEMLNNDPAK